MIPVENAITCPEKTKVLDSCMLTSKAEIREFLETVRRQSSAEMAVNKRDLESQVREWRSHNLFYRLHIFRSRTKDVDLELRQPWWRELFCFVVSFLYFWD